MELNKCRIIIVDKEGKIFPYIWEVGKQHQDCLNEFAEEKFYQFSNIDDIIKQDNSIFYGRYDNDFALFLGKNRSNYHNEVLLSLIDLINLNGIKKYENGFVSCTIEDIYSETNKTK